MKWMEVCKKEVVGNDLHISMEVLCIKYGVWSELKVKVNLNQSSAKKCRMKLK